MNLSTTSQISLHHSSTGLPNGDGPCSLWGTDWKRIAFDERQSSKCSNALLRPHCADNSRITVDQSTTTKRCCWERDNSRCSAAKLQANFKTFFNATDKYTAILMTCSSVFSLSAIICNGTTPPPPKKFWLIGIKVKVKAVCGSYSTAALRHIVLLPEWVPSFISRGAAHTKRRERPLLAKEGTIPGI